MRKVVRPATAPRVKGRAAEFAKLDPPPIAFADRARARDRSLFGLYQVIGQGLEGTAMQSFAALPEDDRWALAFHAGGLAYRDAAAGAQIWREDAAVRALVPDLAALVALTPAELEAKIGPDKAAAVVAYLRSKPDALSPTGGWIARPCPQPPARKFFGICRAAIAKQAAVSHYRPISTGLSRSKRCWRPVMAR